MTHHIQMDETSEAEAGLRIVVLAVPERAATWSGLESSHTFPTTSDARHLVQVLLDEPAAAVIVTEAWREQSHRELTILVDSIRAQSRAGVILEGDFRVGDYLPGKADAFIKVGADIEFIEMAVDAAMRQVQTRLASSTDRAFVQSLLDSAFTLVLAIDGSGRIREFNRACEIITGLGLSNVYGRPISELLVNDRGLIDTIETNNGNLFPSNLELEFKTVEGGSRIVECSFSPFFDETGDLRLAVVTGIDLTEQRRFQTALKESEKSFRSVVESAPDSVVVMTTQDSRWLYANPAALDLIGMKSMDELRQHTIWDFIDPSAHETSRKRLDEIAKSGRAHSPLEVKLKLPNGDSAWIETTEIPIVYRGEAAILAIFRDLTERKEFTARMMQLDRMVAVGTLAAGVGHEINNPLAYLASNVEFATESLRSAKAAEDLSEVILALEEAQEGAARVRDIVRDLKDLARIDKDVVEPVDIESIVESALNVAWHEIRTRAHVTRDFHPVPLVLGAGGRIRQLLVNLLVNAAQAMEGCNPDTHGINIRIAPTEDGECVDVQICDQGHGIPADDLKRVFDPFFTTKPVGSGTGLGLTIAQRIANSVGGSIDIESELGTGTCVTVRLQAAPVVATESNEHQPNHEVPLRVLLIDDEPMIAKSVTRALVESSEVVAFQNGAHALDHLAEDRDFDAILCDLVMPGVSGPDLQGVVAERWPDLERRMVFMTGGAYTDAIAEFAQQHESRVIEKPFAAWDLREALYEAARR